MASERGRAPPDRATARSLRRHGGPGRCRMIGPVRTVEWRLGAARGAGVGVAFGMGRFTFGLTLPTLRSDPSISATGLSDPLLGLIAGGTFAGFLVGIVG